MLKQNRNISTHKKKTKTFEKKIKKIKINHNVAVSINSEFVKNFDENVLTCSIMLKNYFVKNKRFMLRNYVVKKKMFVCSIMISIYTFSKIFKNCDERASNSTSEINI